MLMQPPIETFGTNKLTLGVVVAFALLDIWGFYGAFTEGSIQGLAVLFGLGVVGFALWIAWLLSVRVSLHENGIAYQSLFGSKQMLWNEVDRFYYSALKRSINFRPAGTYHSFKLQDSRGLRLSFGNRVERPAELGSKLIQLTYPTLLQKLAARFDSGIELEFGPVRLSRLGGIQIKKFFRVVKIPLDSVAGYRIEAGSLYILRVGKRTPGISIGRIPNAFVLLGLLDAIYKPATV